MVHTIMGKIFIPLLLLSSVLSIASSIRATFPNNNIDLWCNQTPHPESCKYYTSKISNYQEINDKSLFRLMLVQLALKQVRIMHSEAQEIEQSLMSKSHKALHNNCLELYDNTIFHLNRTIECMNGKRNNCSPFDAQTWLSTAHTNIKTCPTAASELNVVDFKVSKWSSNVTEIISNSLAINMDFLKQNANNHHTTKGGEEKFPSWVSSSDKKLLMSSSSIKADLVVAQDGSGKYRNIQDAINEAAKRKSETRFVIHVKKGTYKENIKVGVNNDNIMLIGDGAKQTMITGSKNAKDGFSIMDSPTVAIHGSHFIARDITFQNKAGPLKGQAVALRSASDFSVFYRCSVEGYQDTLFIEAQRQYFTQCRIYGTIDFIFGDAAVEFQNCMIYARKPLQGQANVITAQGRDQEHKNTGILIKNCQIRASADLKPVVGQVTTFLGRPWKKYARVVIMNSFLDTLVNPKGWSPMGDTNFALDTLYFGEYKNYGPGSSTSNRVKWPTFHVLRNPSEVFHFTTNALLSNSTTNVPINLGL